MNSFTIPVPAPELKLPRASASKWAATLAEERRRLQSDEQALRERETNLREYEARLRAWQEEIDASRAAGAGTGGGGDGEAQASQRAAGTSAPFVRPSSRSPFADDGALQAAWEKLHRARELMEAEQVHMRDDRIAMRDREAAVKAREEAVKRREAILAEREALVAAAAVAPEPQPVAAEHTMSTVAMLTRSPFEMARTIFRKK